MLRGGAEMSRKIFGCGNPYIVYPSEHDNNPKVIFSEHSHQPIRHVLQYTGILFV